MSERTTHTNKKIEYFYLAEAYKRNLRVDYCDKIINNHRTAEGKE